MLRAGARQPSLHWAGARVDRGLRSTTIVGVALTGCTWLDAPVVDGGQAVPVVVVGARLRRRSAASFFRNVAF